jgi:hypothetical protein
MVQRANEHLIAAPYDLDPQHLEVLIFASTGGFHSTAVDDWRMDTATPPHFRRALSRRNSK